MSSQGILDNRQSRAHRVAPDEIKPADYFNRPRPEMLPYVPDGARTVLDVGCSEGEFGRVLKERQACEYWGIEVSADAARVAETKLDRVILGNIETGDVTLPADFFDCIVFNDVLEHLVDPWSVLRKARPALKATGVIVASLPNVRYHGVLWPLLTRGEWDYADSGVLDRTHLRFFTHRSAAELFGACGYDVVKSAGINATPMPRKLALANRLLRGAWDEMRYTQFAYVASKQRSGQDASS